MKHILALAIVFLMTSVVSPQSCPTNDDWDCQYGDCDKYEVGTIFQCCMTPASGYCCPCWCQAVGCRYDLGGGPPLYCPMESGSDGIDRLYSAIQGPGYQCHPVHGTCVLIP